MTFLVGEGKCFNDLYYVLFFFEAPKKSRVRFSNIMEIRQLPSSHALEAKLSRMSYPTVKEQEFLLKTVGKLTATQVAKISFFFCFVVRLFIIYLEFEF